MTGVLIIAHAPLAHALRQCALHVFPDLGRAVVALDVQPNTPPDETLAMARAAMRQLGTSETLVLTDVFGATPCNIAQRLVEGVHSSLVTGCNLPMLLRALTYRNESLESQVARALSGGTQGIMSVAITAPQNQARRNHDQDRRDHQQ